MDKDSFDSIMANDKKEPSVEEAKPINRSIWKKRIDFFLTLLGMSIGLGNVWRFPYLCYKNGGGVFLVAYITLLVVFVVPVIIMELSIGQYTRGSAVQIWKLVPVFKGIGIAMLIIQYFSNIYYPIVMAWALRWLVAGFSSGMPWCNCNNTWNEDNCIPLIADEGNASLPLRYDQNDDGVSNFTGLTSVEEFWKNNIIGLSPGIEQIGGVKWDLALCLFAIWLLVYFSIWKGIAWTSKVVYVTATLPLVMIVVVLVRGVTLDGASKGIAQYLQPNMTKLGSVEVWKDAADQVTFSFIIGYGCLITLSSHNQFDHNFVRDALLVSFSNALTSFSSGFAIFSVLGHLAEVKNTSVSAVAESGPGLAFVIYPTALSFLPWPNFWMMLFFLTMILLGLDSLFVIQDGTFECTKDLFPSLFRSKWNHEIGHAVLSSILFLLGLPLVTEGGMYIFHIFNTHTVAGWCVYFVIFCETLALGWIYGVDKICRQIGEMVSWRVSRWWLLITLKFISPILTFVLMFYSLYQLKPLTYDITYVYPVWSIVLAWLSAFSSIIFIPITAVYVIAKSKGNNLWEKIRNSTKPVGKIMGHEVRNKLQATEPYSDNEI